MLTVKIMGESPTGEVIGDNDWRKPHQIFTGVKTVDFDANSVNLTFVGTDETTQVWAVENVYVMNDAGKTISSYQAPKA